MSKIDTAPAQFPIAETRGLGAVAASDLARRGARGGLIVLVGLGKRLDPDLIFGMRHRRQFCQKH
jgi:hypothetical protein